MFGWEGTTVVAVLAPLQRFTSNTFIDNLLFIAAAESWGECEIFTSSWGRHNNKKIEKHWPNETTGSPTTAKKKT